MLELGTLLQNRYEIIKPIGQGGMGAVYLARDQRLSNTVALKETFFSDTTMLAAFEREARLLAGLRHTALPKVIDHFADHNGQFLVMEYITGDDLYDLIEENGHPAPLDEVLRWADQLLDALDYLHSQNPPIIHRDIKPQNLKLTSRNQIVLLDFGLAKGTRVEMTLSDSNSSIFGYTPSYAPLEQIQGSGTDVRSDLYSLAATLYHLLTGQKPADALTRASAILNGQPDPLASASDLNALIPVQVSEVLSRGMVLNKNQRLASAAEMRDLLRDAARPGRAGVTAKPSSPFLHTEVNRSDSAAALPGASTHVLASAPATAAQASEKTGLYTTSGSATNLARATPARANESRVNRPRPGTAAQRRSATVEVANRGESNLPKIIAAAAILIVAMAIVVFVFTRGVRRDEASAAPITVQKTEAATAAPQQERAASEVSDRGGSNPGPQPAASSKPSATEEPSPQPNAADQGKVTEVTQEARQEETRRDPRQAPSMQEPEGTKPLPRQVDEEPKREPAHQERPAPPPDQGPPPGMYPPPPGFPPPGGPPPGGPPPGGPQPGRRRP
jgi:serine/threonine protein kinase